MGKVASDAGRAITFDTTKANLSKIGSNS